MEQIISKEEFAKLKRMKGEVRGVALKGEADFVLKEEGREGLERLEEVITNLGYPIRYKEIKATRFYPLWLEALTLLVIKRLFNYKNEKFQKIGSFESKISLIIRLFMKYFVSLERMIKEVPKMWRKYYTIGNLKVIEFNKEKRQGVLRLEGFQSTPLLQETFKGVFSSVIQMIINRPVICEEKRCSLEKDDCYEFLLKW